jgi:hypothetical protein
MCDTTTTLSANADVRLLMIERHIKYTQVSKVMLSGASRSNRKLLLLDLSASRREPSAEGAVVAVHKQIATKRLEAGRKSSARTRVGNGEFASLHSSVCGLALGAIITGVAVNSIVLCRGAAVPIISV